MSDEKLYSEAGARERERAAFAAGAEWCDNEIILLDDGEAMEEARRRFPITRRVPRVVKVELACGAYRVRVRDGAFELWTSGRWTPQYKDVVPDTVRALADLLANPFEEVAE
jgi:hypothetical protein